MRVTTGYTEMRTTTPVTIKRHVLPGEESGDTAWFQRQNPFEQREVLRQVAFKRCRWPDLPDGHSSKHPTYTYPHILPAGYEGMAFYGPLADDILFYLAANDIAPHSELLNLKSSQAACFNFLFPLRQDLDLARAVLRPLLPGLREVTAVEFEYTGPEGTIGWLGEPKRGKRGQNRISIEAALVWMNTLRGWLPGRVEQRCLVAGRCSVALTEYTGNSHN